MRDRLGENALLIGKVMGPWTLSYHLHGVEDTLIDSILEEDKLHEFIDRFKSITKTFIQAQLEAGADVITLADHATADLVQPAIYERFLLPVHREIIETFGGERFILHCCGNTLDRIPLFAKAGFHVFHFDSKNDISKAISAAGGMRLTGCINNPNILLNGTRADVARQTSEILKKGIRLVSPECAIPL